MAPICWIFLLLVAATGEFCSSDVLIGLISGCESVWFIWAASPVSSAQFYLLIGHISITLPRLAFFLGFTHYPLSSLPPKLGSVIFPIKLPTEQNWSNTKLKVQSLMVSMHPSRTGQCPYYWSESHLHLACHEGFKLLCAWVLGWGWGKVKWKSIKRLISQYIFKGKTDI